MIADRKQTAFLARGSLSLIVFLTIWWLVLASPMVDVLQYAAEFSTRLLFGGRDPMRLEANGDWSLRVPVDGPVRDGQKIRSMDFTIARSDIIGFTVSLPIYWAVVFAAPGARGWRAMLKGTTLICFAELALFLGFVEITAYNAAAEFDAHASGATAWLRAVAYFLIVIVSPFAVPFVTAASLEDGLRSFIVGNLNARAADTKPARGSGKAGKKENNKVSSQEAKSRRVPKIQSSG